MFKWNDSREFFSAEYDDWNTLPSPALHIHLGRHELCIVESGRSTIFVDSHVFTAEGSYAIFYPRGIEHKQLNDDSHEYRRWLITFPQEFLSPVLERKKQPQEFFVLHLPPETLRRIVAYCSRLTATMTESVCEFLENERRYLTALILNELDALPKSDNLAIDSSLLPLEKRIRQICYYIDHNPTADLTITGLVGKFYINRTTLTRLFKSTTGTTVNSYVKMARLIHAKKLLCERQPLAEVVRRSGFSSISYFIRVFKSEEGTTPAKYYATVMTRKKSK